MLFLLKELGLIKLEHSLKKIADLCSRLRVVRLELFGSAAREDFTDDSDVDLLVEFADDEDLFDRFFDLKEGLEEIFSRKVDLVMKDGIHCDYFKRSIEDSRRCIYVA
ncbi:MAG: nucleotidyltransferase domain-containing protein [Candidatus Riflebacteria bacterium]|nr:nucleotidyltransferase domain-containing protein [Candidatus Riflebacteria bacterium]